MVSINQRIGEYCLLESLGQGGMGIVHLARQEDSGDIVALKTIQVASEETKGTTFTVTLPLDNRFVEARSLKLD